ncbi:MAG: VCBS repeat-containing protein, partial [Deltaproteobacteria bacterium]|nr:VCBS repeat-containing protein [Deltaproteobacteria bacterium]
MSISLGLNLDTLRSLRLLNKHAQSQANASDKLSSGSRINNASDDAAGLAVASGLAVKRNLFSRAMLNISDGVSALSIAEGSVRELSGVTDRLLELAQQAANGSLSTSQRLSLQKESDQLIAEFNRITSSTTFNGNSLLTGGFRSLNIHVGIDGVGSLQTGIGTGLAHTQWNGTNATGVQLAGTSGGFDIGSGDFDGDGDVDLATVQNGTGNVAIHLQNADGTFATTFAGTLLPSSLTYLTVGDVNGDGDLDIVTTSQSASGGVAVLSNNGSGVFSQSASENFGGFARNVRLADFNGDGKLDIATAVGSSGLRILNGNGDGKFKSSVSYNFSGNIYSIDTADMDGDGDMDIVAANATAAHSFAVYTNDGNASFSQTTTIGSATATDVTLGDFDRDGYVDVLSGGSGGTTLYRGLGQGQFDSGTSLIVGSSTYFAKVADLNGDGYLDLYAQAGALANGISYRLGNGDGTFQASAKVTTTSSSAVVGSAAVDINGDGVLDFLGIVSNRLNSYLSNASTTTSIGVTTLARASDARAAIDTLTTIKDRLSKELSALGSSSSRLSSAFNTAAAQRDATAGAESAIT